MTQEKIDIILSNIADVIVKEIVNNEKNEEKFFNPKNFKIGKDIEKSQDIIKSCMMILYQNAILDKSYEPEKYKEQLYIFIAAPIQEIENIYINLKSDAEKELLFNMLKNQFASFTISSSFNQLKDTKFINAILDDYYTNKINSYDYYYNNFLDSVLKHSEKNPNFILTEKNLDFLMRNSKHFLSNIKNQLNVKNFIEAKFPEKIEKYKKYWKKVDLTNINNENVVSEGAAYTISFNKIYLHNLNPNNPDEKGCLSRLRGLVTYLNKPTTQKLLNIQGVLIDNIASEKKEYRFFLVTDDINNKNLLKRIIIQVAQNEACIDDINLQKTINFELLDSKINKDKENKRQKTKKI